MDNMTAKVWKEPLEPKYHGSLNLHELLPQDLDFCIFLSSFAGVNGNGGQSNYAAGNTYQASLARHRIQNGLRGTTVDLGLILEGSPKSRPSSIESIVGFHNIRIQIILLGGHHRINLRRKDLGHD